MITKLKTINLSLFSVLFSFLLQKSHSSCSISSSQGILGGLCYEVPFTSKILVEKYLVLPVKQYVLLTNYLVLLVKYYVLVIKQYELSLKYRVLLFFLTTSLLKKILGTLRKKLRTLGEKILSTRRKIHWASSRKSLNNF